MYDINIIFMILIYASPPPSLFIFVHENENLLLVYNEIFLPGWSGNLLPQSCWSGPCQGREGLCGFGRGGVILHNSKVSMLPTRTKHVRRACWSKVRFEVVVMDYANLSCVRFDFVVYLAYASKDGVGPYPSWA